MKSTITLAACLCALSLPGCAFLGNDPVNPASVPVAPGAAPGGSVPSPVNGGSAAPVNGGSAAPVNGGSAAPVNGGSAAPPQGITFDGGPGAAAYLACRQRAIDSGAANAQTIGTIDAACVAQAAP